METRFQTSFIPKKPVVDSKSASGPYKVPTDLLTTVSSLIFIVALLATGGAFFYKNYLQSAIDQADKELNEARSAFEVDRIQELLDTSSRFQATKSLLEKHVVTSEVFLLLQTLTVKSLRFSNFTYRNENGNLRLSMSAEASTFNAVVEQSKAFSESGFMKENSFSEFTLKENNLIDMKFTAILLPELVSYKKVTDFASTPQ